MHLLISLRLLLPAAVTTAVAACLLLAALVLYSPVWATQVSPNGSLLAVIVDESIHPGINPQSSTCTDGFAVVPEAIPGGVEVRWTCDHPAEMRGKRLDRESDEAPRAGLSSHWHPDYTGPIPKRFADLDNLWLINGYTYRYQIKLLDADENAIATSSWGSITYIPHNWDGESQTPEQDTDDSNTDDSNKRRDQHRRF